MMRIYRKIKDEYGEKREDKIKREYYKRRGPGKERGLEGRFYKNKEEGECLRGGGYRVGGGWRLVGWVELG